jgi:guanylate kinase
MLEVSNQNYHERFLPVGMFGPSYVGKTCFGRYLVESGPFRRLPIWTSRPPRIVENDPDVRFTTEDKLIPLEQDEMWLVNKIGPHYYAMSLEECRSMLNDSHVIVGLTTGTKNSIKRRLPSLFTVLLWPENFDALQKELAQTSEREMNDREVRLAMNIGDTMADLSADLVLGMARHADIKKRQAHFAALKETLLVKLKQRLDPDKLSV